MALLEMAPCKGTQWASKLCIDRSLVTTRFKTFIVDLRHILWNFILYYFILLVGAIHEVPGQLNWPAPVSFYFCAQAF